MNRGDIVHFGHVGQFWEPTGVYWAPSRLLNHPNECHLVGVSAVVRLAMIEAAEHHAGSIPVFEGRFLRVHESILKPCPGQGKGNCNYAHRPATQFAKLCRDQVDPELRDTVDQIQDDREQEIVAFMGRVEAVAGR